MTSFTTTSPTVGTGNLTLDDNLDSMMPAGTVLNVMIWQETELFGMEWENSTCTYLGAGVLSRNIVIASSSNDALVSFREGQKTINGELPTAIDIKYTTNVAITNNHIAVGNVAINSTSIAVGSVAVYSGTGAPGLSAAKGSLYMRTDGSSSNNRMYINTNGSVSWTPVMTET